MSIKNNIDWQSVIAFIVVTILAVLSLIFQNEVMWFVKVILEKQFLKIGLITAVFVILLTHVFRVGVRGQSEFYLVRSGLLPLDAFLTFGTYLAVLSTGCTLLEGAYIQQFYGSEPKYFNNFKPLDINVLLGVSALLIWYVLLHTFRIAYELFFTSMPVSSAAEFESSTSA